MKYFLLSGFLLASGFLAAARAATAPTVPLAPDQALQELKDGNRRFVSGATNERAGELASRVRLKDGQAPDAVVLGCSDSRVPPEQVFDQGLGKVFTVRVAGNVLDDDAIASFEYAVTKLGTRLLVILGHESCGAVSEALGTPAGKSAGSPSLDQLLSQIRGNLKNAPAPAESGVGTPGLHEAVRENVAAVARSLVRRSAIIREAVASGRVRVVQAVYDLASGKVEFLG